MVEHVEQVEHVEGRAKQRILIVDDDDAVGLVLETMLAELGYEPEWVSSGAKALERIAERPVDLLLTDLRMPGMDGLELLRRAREADPDLPAVVITAHGTVAHALEALKLGAADFLSKPFDGAELAFVIPKALGTHRPQARRGELAAGGVSRKDVMGQWGDALAMRDMGDRIRRAARGAVPVLIRGETGVGKELVARAIHEQSERKSRPFIVVHCGAYPESLLEAELFGYEKGAFTGASTAKPGRFELADGGTVLLDELGEISLNIQVKLLRVVVDGMVSRLGGTRARKLDLRWLSATHQPLEEMVRDGRFREDLYYRLDVLPIEVPPLRNRLEDVDRLAAEFWQRESLGYGAHAATIEPAALTVLRAQPWPGNVRQLENFIRRLAALADGMGDDMRVLTRDAVERELSRGRTVSSSAVSTLVSTLTEQNLVRSRDAAERGALLEARTQTAGNRKKMAALLGVSLRKLYYLLNEHGIE